MRIFNYRNYDYTIGKWNYKITSIPLLLSPSNSFNLGLERATNHYLEQEINTLVKKNTSEETIPFTKDTIKILNVFLYHSLNIPERVIIERTGFSIKMVKKHIKLLKEGEIYSDRVNPIMVFGLINILIILYYNNETCELIRNKFSFFPETFVEFFTSYEGKDFIQVVVRIPSELAFTFINSLKYYWSESIVLMTFIDEMYGARYQLPIDNFESLDKEWEYTQGEIYID